MKNKRSNKVLGVLEDVYSRIWYLEKDKRLIKYKRSSSKFQRNNKYRSQETREIGSSSRRRLQKREFFLEKYIVKMLYRWDNRKFEREYLKKLERN